MIGSYEWKLLPLRYIFTQREYRVAVEKYSMTHSLLSMEVDLMVVFTMLSQELENELRKAVTIESDES